MKQLNNQRSPIYFTAILYIIGFFLFLEWLYPVGSITDTGGMNYFILFAVVCFSISLFQIKWWLSFIIKGLGMLFFIHLLTFDISLFDPNWVKAFIVDMGYNIDMLISKEWYEFTPVFRSSLFLLLIWLMSYLIHYWFVFVKRVLLFILLTFIYLSVLDTFTVYEAKLSIIRVFIFSFMALGMANFIKQMESEKLSFQWMKKSSHWLLPIIGVVIFSTLVGYAAPKSAPKWPDPIPFIQDLTGTGGDSSTKKVGYGEDDSQLGGSFIQDETRVFDAKAKSENYWRIETKDTYTGKGWDSKSGDDEIKKVQSDSRIPIKTFSDDVETEKLQASIKMNPDMALPKLIYPYGISEVELGEDMEILISEQNEDLKVAHAGQEVNIQTYSVIYNEPSFDIKKLREGGDDPDDITERYTQVPNNLPERVRELAEEITDPYDTRYDKTLAIERHFGQSNEFTYETKDIPVPRGNTDYVDQFLFDSKKGYCDNYSTSMVVMLRTLGIPARWAKGFTSGENITDEANDEEISDDYNLYEVTNMNAHSWPEVYFSDVGWVPFEPTQGFSNFAEFHEELDVEGEDGELDASELEPEESEPEDAAEEDEEATDEAEEDQIGSSKANSFQLKTWQSVTLGILFIVILIALYRIRFRIQAYFIGKQLEKNPNDKSVQKAYHFLLKVLSKQGYHKDAQQTLREYAREIDVMYSTRSMGVLTSDYEQILYNKKGGLDTSSEFAQLWKDLIRNIIS